MVIAKTQAQSAQSILRSSSGRIEGLTEALNNSILAEEEALKRAEFSSRRLARVRLLQDEIRKEIEAIQAYRRSTVRAPFETQN